MFALCSRSSGHRHRAQMQFEVLMRRRNVRQGLALPRQGQFGRACPSISSVVASTSRAYPDIGTLIPAMGYGKQQMQDLQETLNRVECDTVIVATPIDLGRILQLARPAVRVTCELDDSMSDPNLATLIRERLG